MTTVEDNPLLTIGKEEGEENPLATIEEEEEEEFQTPTMNTIRVENHFDLQRRADQAEKDLYQNRFKLERERKRTRRLETQINDYVVALSRSVQDCTRVMNQCQTMSTTNMALSHELRKSKTMVETLEAVILLLYNTAKEKNGATESSRDIQ